jgi:hypothetical protein
LAKRGKGWWAGLAVSLLGVLTLCLWIFLIVALAPWKLADGPRIILPAVGSALTIVGLVIVRENSPGRRPPA